YIHTKIHTLCCLSKPVMLNSPNMLQYVKCFTPCVFKSPLISLLNRLFTLLPNMS
uniref:Uncharacterized protein n=1 Tax=Panthera tigris altaica TaxID=74533 RepID=A0A8C9JQ42_PANTA